MGNAPLDREFARHFSEDWIASWNAHDLERILSHYADDFEMNSPIIAQIAGEPSGILKGKGAVAEYWRLALERIPELHFELREVLLGVGSVTICYQGVSGPVAEVFHFGADGKVVRAYAHYV